MSVRQFLHQDMKARFSLGLAGRQQILYQLEHADDVPPFPRVLFCWRQIFRKQKNDGGEQTFRRVIKKGILTVGRGIPLRVHNSLGEDLGVLLRFGTGGQILLVLLADVHIVVDQGQQVVAV